MKIIIVTQEDPFYIPFFFKSFFKLYAELKDQITLKGIIIQNALGNKSICGLIKRVWTFYGSFYFIIYGFKYV